MSSEPQASQSIHGTAEIQARLSRRHRWDRRFRWCSAGAVALAVGCLLFLFGSILTRGLSGFVQTKIELRVGFDAELLGVPPDTRDPDALQQANYLAVLTAALETEFPDVTERQRKRELRGLVSSAAPFTLREELLADPSALGQSRAVWVLADDDIDMLAKGHVRRDVSQHERRVSDEQIAWFDELVERGRVRTGFNVTLFTRGDSREPEQAGILGALVGSLFTLGVTLILSFPLGVATAVYLEEFAPRNRWTDLIEVNINNLAAVPSIVFGLLGLAVFINVAGLPRSTAIVGGLVLTLMTLPTIIIASRAALKAVPRSLRDAALAVGASPVQVVAHHVVPVALPGMLTGAIIGMAQALGETAPLLMIGMVAFIVDIPGTPFEPATALPVQIYLWADSPERAFEERTSAAILVLLAFLVTMNWAAVALRRRFERRW